MTQQIVNESGLLQRRHHNVTSHTHTPHT